MLVRATITLLIEADSPELVNAAVSCALDAGDVQNAVLGYEHDGEPIHIEDASAICHRAKRTTRTITCTACGKPCDLQSAHRHDGGWIGDSCCWDERLRLTE